MDELAYRDDERHPLLERYLETWGQTPPLGEHPPVEVRPSFDISASDEMYRYALEERHQHRGIAVLEYARSGFGPAQVALEVLAWARGDQPTKGAAATPRILDFAAGHGRVTRYLAAAIGRQRVTVAEVVPSAVKFQREVLGVEAVQSSHTPEGLEAQFNGLASGNLFDGVFAFSLFSHLPEHRFIPWLRALWERVDAGGVLAVTTHGESARLGRPPIAESGFEFERYSESAVLSAEEYGSTWVAPHWMERAVRRACSGCQPILIERGVWNLQDLWIMVRDEAQGASPRLRGKPRVTLLPFGSLERVQPKGPARLRLDGWVHQPGASPLTIEARVERSGEVIAEAAGQADLVREDVALAQSESFARCGFQLMLDRSDPFRFDDLLIVEAVDRGSTERPASRHVLQLSFVEGADLVGRVAGVRRDAAVEARLLRHQIAIMERSRFWRLRNRWFAWKRALGLTEQD